MLRFCFCVTRWLVCWDYVAPASTRLWVRKCCDAVRLWQKLVLTPALWFECEQECWVGCNPPAVVVVLSSFRCGAARGYGVQPQPPAHEPGRPPYTRQGGSHANNITRVVPRPFRPALLPRCQKKDAQAARKAAAAAAAAGFTTSDPLTKVHTLELLKGDLDGELFVELQTRLAKPKVVRPKKKEDALLQKRIEKDKAKDHQAKLDQRVENLRNDLDLAVTQAEENRQRVLVLQSEWQALHDQVGEETDEQADAQPSRDPDTDGMDASDGEQNPILMVF